MPKRIEFLSQRGQSILQVTALLLLIFRQWLGVATPLLISIGCAHTPSPDPFTPPVLTETKGHDFTCRGLMTEGKRNGVWECRNSDGGPRSKITYKENIKDGPAEFWFENGQRDSYGEWKNGELHGAFRSYRRDGSLHLETTYKAGLIDGVLREWNEAGKLVHEGSYKAGAAHGRIREWYPNGNLKTEGLYRNNQLIAPETRWNEQGHLIIEK